MFLIEYLTKKHLNLCLLHCAFKKSLYDYYSQLYGEHSSSITFLHCSSILIQNEMLRHKNWTPRQHEKIYKVKKFLISSSSSLVNVLLKKRQAGWMDSLMDERKERRKRKRKKEKRWEGKERERRKRKPSWNKSRKNYCKFMNCFACTTSEVLEWLSFSEPKCLIFLKFPALAQVRMNNSSLFSLKIKKNRNKKGNDLISFPDIKIIYISSMTKQLWH